METMIPNEVLEHLRSLSEEQAVDPLRGGFTVEQYMDVAGVTQYRARKDLRTLIRDGLLQVRVVGISQPQAEALGYISAGRTTAFYWTGAS